MFLLQLTLMYVRQLSAENESFARWCSLALQIFFSSQQRRGRVGVYVLLLQQNRCCTEQCNISKLWHSWEEIYYAIHSEDSATKTFSRQFRVFRINRMSFGVSNQFCSSRGLRNFKFHLILPLSSFQVKARPLTR